MEKDCEQTSVLPGVAALLTGALNFGAVRSRMELDTRTLSVAINNSG